MFNIINYPYFNINRLETLAVDFKVQRLHCFSSRNYFLSSLPIQFSLFQSSAVLDQSGTVRFRPILNVHIEPRFAYGFLNS